MESSEGRHATTDEIFLASKIKSGAFSLCSFLYRFSCFLFRTCCCLLSCFPRAFPSLASCSDIVPSLRMHVELEEKRNKKTLQNFETLPRLDLSTEKKVESSLVL